MGDMEKDVPTMALHLLQPHKRQGKHTSKPGHVGKPWCKPQGRWLGLERGEKPGGSRRAWRWRGWQREARARSGAGPWDRTACGCSLTPTAPGPNPLGRGRAQRVEMEGSCFNTFWCPHERQERSLARAGKGKSDCPEPEPGIAPMRHTATWLKSQLRIAKVF